MKKKNRVTIFLLSLSKEQDSLPSLRTTENSLSDQDRDLLSMILEEVKREE